MHDCMRPSVNMQESVPEGRKAGKQAQQRKEDRGEGAEAASQHTSPDVLGAAPAAAAGEDGPQPAAAGQEERLEPAGPGQEEDPELAAPAPALPDDSMLRVLRCTACRLLPQRRAARPLQLLPGAPLCRYAACRPRMLQPLPGPLLA